ncbi:MAG: hypothetical protein WD045_12080 [Pirellulaceae bacterium]
MGRTYGGILGLVAFATVIGRGMVALSSIESVVLIACVAMFLFVGLGWIVGNIAARIVDESVRQKVNAELDGLQHSMEQATP